MPGSVWARHYVAEREQITLPVTHLDNTPTEVKLLRDNHESPKVLKV
jgi:hypothetical protein